MQRPLQAGGGDRDRHARPLLRTMLGAALRRARRAQGRTLADVARSAKVSMQYLSELERGRKEASSEVLAAICGALRIDLADLLAEVGRRFAAAQRPRVIRLGSAGGVGLGAAESPELAGGGAGEPQPDVRGRSGDAVCLLAA
jgi:transcriptional regulator with XRE-family HTH domain